MLISHLTEESLCLKTSIFYERVTTSRSLQKLVLYAKLLEKIQYFYEKVF
jgi:hypothetical protein